MINRFLYSWRAFRVTWRNNCRGMDDLDYWDQSNGCCSQCGAPLNEYLIGGYKLHNEGMRK